MSNYNENFENFNRTVYTIDLNNDKIVEHVLSDICREYAEEVSSPEGVSTRYHVIKRHGYIYNHTWYYSKDLAEEAQHDDIEFCGKAFGSVESSTRFELCKWNYSGDRELVEAFDSEEEAQYELLLSHKYDLYNGSDNPTVFDTRQEAVTALRELKDQIMFECEILNQCTNWRVNL